MCDMGRCSNGTVYVKDYTETWRDLIDEAMGDDDCWENVVAIASEEGLYTPFNPELGSHEGSPFTVWTKEYVYFPKEYDGAEYAVRVARNPNGIATEHV